MTIALQKAVSDARASLKRPGESIGAATSASPRFELFNAPNSICSQKVRTVLAHHQIPYRSQHVDIFEGETYLPAYVRLRMAGCEALGGGLVNAHTGSTSVTAGGCDPAVVPLLVDWETGEVLVDSKRICFYLDKVAAKRPSLRPAGLEKQVDAQLDVVDNLPNYQMLAGKPPGVDHRPESRRKSNGVGFAMGKVERCDRYLAEFSNDADLVKAYSAKRAKELNAAEQLFTPEAMQAAYDKAEAGCASLERVLDASSSQWLLGDNITMADLYWGIELLRMKNMAVESFWANGAKPSVAAFVEKAGSIPAIRSAIVEWPGALY
ncbi:MAG: glutathione S-transferase family protein [Polaromonas sp.]|uniref:glutathione S-transferase family protein n=1 Tax=Polaromonas sp. TaxID=1869339 RepID=UPI0025DAF14A|nr:glutathione S-transferase family protein [Polaromonas sp.]MBI2725386.1 glutathione S-transferase family protein [Polaromonas sp.]